jgi:hypothetical protein
MSRAELARALTAAGLDGLEHYPDGPIAAGQGWPEWVSTSYRETSGGCEVAETRWIVWVVLPPFDTPAAADRLRDLIAAELAAVAAVDEVTPALITVTENAGNGLPALRYTARTTP